MLADVLVSSVPVADVFFAFRESNASGQAIVIVLFIGSIFVWTIMITKWREMNLAATESRRFLAAYRKEAHPASLFLKRVKYEGTPMYTIYRRTCEALGSALEARGASPDDLFKGSIGGSRMKLSQSQLNAVRNCAERTMADQALLMEQSMGLLATATTTAPFLGLLGTVWGVMDAFGAMAIVGSAMLSAVAPGISGALLTTVIGLLVALPSAIGYNGLTDKIRHMSVEMDNFLQELVVDMENHYHAET